MQLLHTMQFNTGRQYTAAGQEITAHLIETDSHGLVIYFIDHSRGLDYMYQVDRIADLNQYDIMKRYDNGGFDLVVNDAGEYLHEYQLKEVL